MPQVPVLLTFDNLFLHLHPPSKPPFHHPTVLSPQRNAGASLVPQSQSNLQGEYLEQSQRSRTRARKVHYWWHRTLSKDKLWRVLSAGELVTLRRPLVRPPSRTHHNSQDLTNQEETLATAQRSNKLSVRTRPRNYRAAHHPLDLPTHSPRLPPPSVHGSLTVISSSQPVATGLGHHITHPAITKSEANDTVDQRKSIEGQAPLDQHALSDTKTTSRSRGRPPLSQQDPQVPPEDTQTVPEDLEVDQVNIQTVPKTSTNTQSRISLVQHTDLVPGLARLPRRSYVRSATTQAPPSQHARVTQVQPATNRCRRVSQPAPPTGTQPEPINVADGLPPTRGRTRTRGVVGVVQLSGLERGFMSCCRVNAPSRATLGLGGREPCCTSAHLPDISLQRNSSPLASPLSPALKPSASQQTSNPPNRPPTAPAPRTTPGPQISTSLTVLPQPASVRHSPSTGNRQPPPKTLAGPSLSSLTQPNLPYLANRWAIQGKHPSSNPVAQGDNRGARQARAQVAALISSDPIVTRPTPENGAELVSDDDEEQAAEAAVAQGREPPSSRNTHGVSRLVLQLAKLHFWAYALAEGPYQTRAVFITWVRVLWRKTWLMEAPGTPFRDITDEEIQCGSCYETRPCQRTAAFCHRRHHPNSFHCLEQEPERRGHYESELMHHAFALALFHNEGAVGVVFSEYFEDLAPATVAFILANIQFCLEEWSTGKHENRDLGTGQMLAKFESHLMAWNEFRRTAPRRARALTREWFEYGLHYSNATQPVEEQGLLPSQVAEFRADTPAEEPNQSDRTLNEQVAYTQQIQELGLDEEFDEGPGEESGEGLIQEVDEEMADLWTQEWVDDDEWGSKRMTKEWKAARVEMREQCSTHRRGAGRVQRRTD
ncbi:hypothetical protein RHS01_10890 [Rhizoctonia solani]|uniref:DUF6532 domain-containing protein n=1 Tax=Rhizoctonia solani TaxID=456999 RepID=A0A8H7I4F2_9AGAM|nr:hypothetical protein RHS01_10890 [Rhizoctonia solani]